MTLSAFLESLSQAMPPAGTSPYLASLWWDGKGNWQKAHDIIEHLDGDTAAWVHAYLHRKEGDRGNARYWYSRAGQPMPEVSLEQEWKDMVTVLSGR
ncbi:hypothetical protein SAMN05428949_2965 [Chitinophaga sp. YR627]|jgi:hypothetical protein|uniref:hypothetical protein n=1 Tax=Chitinophaga sp. YR627 TaxID=1881041 RepID=UPI0008EC9EE8|nr:hypothetical protein [Chitinophaga sp. YR627]SFN47578.1 hypothetical protein SAMN05428949_2965 [Chitinophaga sp. YR627]